ncbi:lysophospholipid acyltransferase family protein [Sphingomonas glaciei]|uniref:1-acyl-sn-glycerol-3-phosphate acyltransferase n=1 Tax=Sphingomonas glaciei TaxID=2938948 RepID=A0ABY5MWQ5_9SPHN|nr:lysophospholipid acyltransferase family protein [Sphingomonas glaciei]UUR08205.1 1-acyl-sn-glycerol-3-phosphate acyltransferase [Sphingomonas glaciei]
MTLRAVFLLLAMALWLAVCAGLHLLVRRFGPSPWPRRLLRGVGWLAGARVRTIGPKPSGSTLMVANHVSWLDIPMLAGAADCAFVAKDGLRGHPFMRWLCEENGTVFVERERRGSIGDQLRAMDEALRSHKPLCLFPEGTVGPDGKMLPFRPALLKIAEQSLVPLTVQPVAVDYGPLAAAYGWPAGETGQANFLRLLGRKGRLEVTLHFLDPLAPGQDRKALAATAQRAISAALGVVPEPAAAAA